LKPTSKRHEAVIIGAGAAGLCAAITAAREGLRPLLLEQNKEAGKKIRVSGNGKCNIGNAHIQANRFHSQNPNFIHETLQGFDRSRIEAFFLSIGLPLDEKEDGKLFPLSYEASSVVALLVDEALRCGVKIRYDCRISRLEHCDGTFLLHTDEETITASKLLIASGSVAAPKLGGNDSGYIFAQRMGHTLIPRHPALVQLVTEETWVKQCAGVKMNGVVKLYVNGTYTGEKRGDILFTNYGISGLAILDLSREVSLHLAAFDYCELQLDLMPHFSKERLTNLLMANIRTDSDRELGLWLRGILPKKLATTIIMHASCKSKKERELNRKEINKIVHTIKHLRLSITQTRGFEYAEVATGGIDTTEVDPHTMASKLLPDLYFAGEILDVDGDRGGFNFHFAWVSGIRAGQALAK